MDSGGEVGCRFTQLPTEPRYLGQAGGIGLFTGIALLGLLLGVKDLTALARGETKQGRLEGTPGRLGSHPEPRRLQPQPNLRGQGISDPFG